MRWDLHDKKMIKSHFIRIMLSFYHFSLPVINLSFSVSLPFYFQYHRLYVISFPSQFSSYFLLLLISWSCNTARKTIFSFSKCSERMVFPRNSRWNMITLVLSGKLIFLFPENIFLFFRRKMKDDISQKNTWKCDIFFKCSEKMVFPKKIALEHDLSCFIIWKMIFLFSENIVLFFRRKMKDDLSQKSTWKYIFFKCSEKMVFPKKIMLEHDISCVIWKDGIFCQENMVFFLWTEHERWSFSSNTWKYDIFCIYV